MKQGKPENVSIYWWVYPSRITLFILLPIYIGCGLMDNADFALYKVPAKYLEGETFWLGLGGLLAFAIAAWLAEPRTLSEQTPQPIFKAQALSGVLMTLYILVLIAYAIFLFPLINHPQLVAELAAGTEKATYELRDTLNRVPGITTLSTLQSLCIVLHLGYGRFTGRPIPGKFRFLLVFLILACLSRMWLWSERLALLEILMPATLMTFALPGIRKRRWLIFAPLFGLILIFALFCAGEYFRTWQYYQYTSHYSFMEFAVVRFIGYYATALNNGAAFYNFLEIHYLPTNTAIWFYNFPLWPLLGITFDADVAYDKQTLLNFLSTYGNPEFFNTGGIFMPFCDYGPILGTVCWGVLGYISGTLFKGFVSFRPVGLIVYPVWYIGILEILRVFYWGDGRFFPVLVGGLYIAVYLKRKSLKKNYSSQSVRQSRAKTKSE